MLLEIGSAEGVALNLSVTVSTFRSPRAAPLGGLHLSVSRPESHSGLLHTSGYTPSGSMGQSGSLAP